MQETLKKGRSPRYPRLSLPDALPHAKKLYDGADQSTIDTNTAYRVLGYSGKTGASATVLGALRQYNLVDGLRGDVSISDLALGILQPESERELSKGLMDAFASPEAFSQILDHFSGNVPKSDEPITAFLIRTLGFLRKGASECLKSFRESQAYVEAKYVAGTELVPVPGDEDSSADKADEPENSRVSEKGEVESASPKSSNQFISIPLTKVCSAEIRFDGTVSEDAIERLIAYVELMKPIWSED